MPTLKNIKSWIEKKVLPIAQNYTASERSIPDYYNSILDPKDGVNKQGWRLAHKEPIGIGKLPENQTFALAKLKKHFFKFLSPNNMILVPSSIGAFGEIKTVLDAFVEDEIGTVPTDS